MIPFWCGGNGEYLESLRQHIEARIAALRAKIGSADEKQRLEIEAEIQKLEDELKGKSREETGGCGI